MNRGHGVAFRDTEHLDSNLAPAHDAAMQQTSAHCHKLIAETAKAMAHEVYDALMQRNDWYEGWKKQNPGSSRSKLEQIWVDRTWGTYIASARSALAGLLAQPNLPEQQKEEIMEALSLDSELIKGRANPMQVLGSLH